MHCWEQFCSPYFNAVKRELVIAELKTSIAKMSCQQFWAIWMLVDVLNLMQVHRQTTDRFTDIDSVFDENTYRLE